MIIHHESTLAQTVYPFKIRKATIELTKLIEKRKRISRKERTI